MELQTQESCSATVVDIKGGQSSVATNPLIARGAFGRVDIALLVRRQQASNAQHSSDIQSVSLLAIKTIPNATIKSKGSADKLSREAFAELNSLRFLNGHENVTPLLGYYGANDSSGDFVGWGWAEDLESISPTSLRLVFPYHPIDLHEALVYRRFNPSSKFEGSYYLPKEVVQSVMYDVLSALNHLHSHCIIHRDIKPSNFYITRSGRIQLGDFGLAKIIPPTISESELISADTNATIHTKNVNVTNGLCTLQYRPPEVLLGGSGIIHQFNEATGINGAFDMFSAGCIFSELLTLSGPIFPGKSIIDQIGRIFQVLGTPTEDNWPGVKLLPDWGKVSFEATDGSGLDDKIGRSDTVDEMDLLHEMLVLDPLQRSSARKCIGHKLFASFIGSCIGPNRTDVCKSLLPPVLQVIDPVYFGSTSKTEQHECERDSLDFAKHYAAKMAASRRSFVAALIEDGKCASKERWAW